MNRTICVLLIACAFNPNAGQAEEASCATPAGFQQMEVNALDAGGAPIALRVLRNCLGDPGGDTAAVVESFGKLLKDPAKDATGRVEQVQRVLALLEAYSTSRVAVGADVDAWQRVAIQLREEKEAVATAQSNGIAVADVLTDRFWKIPATPEPVLGGGTIQPFAPFECPASGECPTYLSRKDLLRVFRLTYRLQGFAAWPELSAQLADAKLQTSRWDSYFHKTLPQYWWEVIANGSRMGDTLCPKDSNGMQIGFCSVPTNQIILLHPSAALQWNDGADKTGDLKTAFLIEVFGRNSWKWNKAEVAAQRGWSVVAAYSSSGEQSSRWSYGLMGHLAGSYSVAVTTSGDGDVSVILNVKLAEKFFAQKEKYIDYLKKIEKPSWTSLVD